VRVPTGGVRCRSASAPTYLPTLRSVITRRIARLSELAHLETGKPTGDAAEDDPDLQFAYGGPFISDFT